MYGNFCFQDVPQKACLGEKISHMNALIHGSWLKLVCYHAYVLVL